MDNKKMKILERIQELRDKNVCVEFETLENEGFERELLRAMINEGLINYNGCFSLTEKGNEILRQHKTIKNLETSIKINKEFVKSLTNQAKIVENFIKPLTNLEKIIPKIDVSTIIPKIDYSKLIPKIDYSKLLPDYSSMFRGLFKALENINLESVEKFNSKFPWLDFISLGHKFELGDLLEKESEKKVFEELFNLSCEEKFGDYLSKSFNEIALLNKRKKIILEGYNQHKNKNFVASVSVLTPQIEGIIWDIGVLDGVVQDKKNSKKLIDKKGRVINKINGFKRGEVEWDLKHLMLHLFGDKDPQRRYYQEILYSNLRTPLAHGRDTEFDKLENSVTCLLLIIAMVEKIRELHEDETKN